MIPMREDHWRKNQDVCRSGRCGPSNEHDALFDEAQATRSNRHVVRLLRNFEAILDDSQKRTRENQKRK